MNIKKLAFVLVALNVALNLILTSAWAENSEPPQGRWKKHLYHLQSHGGYLCPTWFEAFNVVLPAIDARNVDYYCTNYDGAWLRFESLEPFPATASDNPVSAFWIPQNITLYREGYRCAELADQIDWLLDRVTVRNVQSSVFCNYNNGYLNYRFEALVPTLQP